MDIGIKGKRAPILGGNRGIGQGIAVALLRARLGTDVPLRETEQERTTP